MTIEITKAIEKREVEIRQLRALAPIIQDLIDDARNAESGKPCMSNKEFQGLREIVVNQLLCLGLARIVGRNENGIGGREGIPTHWSQAKVE